jgi:ATP-dependent Clp protease ATP-binding subunit ClpC
LVEQHDPRTLQVLRHAREEAYRTGQPFVQREQLFFGLLRDQAVRSLLVGMGADPDRLRSAVEAQVAPGLGAPASPDEVAVLPTAQQVFVDRAKLAAGQLGQTTIRPEHVLIGFFLERHGAVLGALTAAGLTKERVLESVKRSLDKGG